MRRQLRVFRLASARRLSGLIHRIRNLGTAFQTPYALIVSQTKSDGSLQTRQLLPRFALPPSLLNLKLVMQLTVESLLPA